MINLLLLLIFLTCTGLSAAWIAENPGEVVIHWFDYRIDTSFAFLLLLALVAAGVLAYAYLFLRHIAHVPELFTRRRSLKHYQKSLSELTYSVAALAAGDMKQAEAHTRGAEKLLGRTPLTLLLSAQVARSKGDDETTRRLLGEMLEYKETEYLAARFLSENASKLHQLPQARELAVRAHALSPSGVAPLLSLRLRLGEWHEASFLIRKSLRKGHMARKQAQHYRAVIAMEQGKKLLADGKQQAALVMAKSALKEQPDFAPAVLFAVKAYDALDQHGKAVKLIYNAWKISPHAELYDALRDIIAPESKEMQMKIVHKLAACNAVSNESDLALADMAIKMRDLDTARKSLKAALEKRETVRTCQLWAALEKLESPGFDRGSPWLNRSLNAIPDSTWICNSCAQTVTEWHAHCPACEAFDTLEWKSRAMAFAG